MTTRMRFRTDSEYAAGEHAKLLAGGKPWSCANEGYTCDYHREWWASTPPAEPGDTWRVRWHPDGEAKTRGEEGPIAGYSICCPKCRQTHNWSTANNCASKREREGGWISCDHSGKGSCWTWSGSAEEGTLSASPSLFANGEGACGWHGFLIDGELHG